MTSESNRPGPLQGREVDAFADAFVDGFDVVLAQVEARAWLPLPGWTPEVEQVRAAAQDLRGALAAARGGRWEPLEALGASLAQAWTEAGVARTGSLATTVAAFKPLIYPALVEVPSALLVQRLQGLDALIGYFGWQLGLELDEGKAEVERDALFLRSIVDNLPNMVFVKSADELRFVRWNHAAERLVGLSHQEVVGKTDADFFPAEEADAFNRSDRAVLASGELLDVPEEPIQTRQRGTRYLHTKKIPIAGPDGRPAYLLGISEDITERKRVLKELQAAKDAAELADHAKSEFLARMSHEIRTPLNGIIGLTELVLESELAAEQRDGLRMVLSSAESLLRLVNEVLDYSRIDAGKLQLEEQAFPLSQLVEETAGGFRLRARAQGLELRLELAEDLPRRVWGDPHRLRQVLSNLLDNALRFTHAGSVWIEVRTDPAGIRLSVGDTGIGVPPEKRELIFAPFDQADGTITRRYGGSGLGLAICKRLVEAMHGRLWVEDAEPGSVFRMVLPLSPVEPTGSTPQPPARRIPEVPSLRVLVAEDNAVNRTLAVRLLEGLGHRAEVATTGQEVLDLLAQDGGFDLLLLDVEMPELSGLDAARAIRERERERGGHLPIVAITARALTGDRERCLEAGMDGYVEKPVRRPRLIEAIAQAVGAIATET